MPERYLFYTKQSKTVRYTNRFHGGLKVLKNNINDDFFLQRCEEMERMDRELNELTNERNALLGHNTSLEGQLTELKEEIRCLYKHNFLFTNVFWFVHRQET